MNDFIFNDDTPSIDNQTTCLREENENYKLVLFPIVSKNPLKAKTSEIVFNAKVTHKASKFVISFSVRKVSGILMIGGSSKLPGYKTLIDEFKDGRSFEKLTIPASNHAEILQLINKATTIWNA